MRLKFTVMQSLLRQYRRFVIVDDSLVRSTTLRSLIGMVRDAAKDAGVDPRSVEVHVRIASPPIIACCYYGIDTPEKTELVAAHQSVDEIARHIGADSLAYLSHDGPRRGGARVRRPCGFLPHLFHRHLPDAVSRPTR